MGRLSHDPVIKKRGRKKGVPTPSEVELFERRQAAMSLMIAGASYADIVKANIGYSSVSHVSHDKEKILQTFDFHAPEDIITMDLARLNQMQMYLTAAMKAGELGMAIPNMLRVMQFRYDILGLSKEAIAEQRTNKANIQNNGIMVVQGSSETANDYLVGLMTAAGATRDEARKELETATAANLTAPQRVSGSQDQTAAERPAERLSGVSARTSKKPLKKIRVVRKSKVADDLVEGIARVGKEMERKERAKEVKPLPADVPVPREVLEGVILEKPIHRPAHNVYLGTGIPYQTPPRPLSQEEHARDIEKRNKGKETDRINTKTYREKI